MKKTLAKIMSSALIAATVFGGTSVTAQAPESGGVELSAQTVDREYVEKVLRDDGVKMSASEFEKFYTECAAPAIEAGEPIVLIDAAASVYNVVYTGTPKVTRWVIYPDGLIEFEFEGDNDMPDEDDIEESREHIVDLTDPAVMYKVLMQSPANPQNGPAPTNEEEQAKYDREIAAFIENLIDTMREMGVELTTGTFEELVSKFEDAEVHAWLRFYRDEARTEEVMLNDIAVGDTVYYKLETDRGYVCKNIDINCHLVVKNHSVYADIPGAEIECKLSVALVGDVNGDGALNAKDITAYMNELIAPKPYGYDHRINSDLNCDGERNARDVVMLMKYMLDPSVEICHHSEYNVNTHLRTYVISVQSEGSDWVDNTQLPVPFPVIDESWLNPDDPLARPFWVQSHGYTMLNYKYVTADLTYYIVNPSGGEFWDNYSCLEIKIPLPKGETNPELVVTDVSSIEDVFGPLLRLSYTIPDGAETVDTAVRFAFSGMREPFPDYHND